MRLHLLSYPDFFAGEAGIVSQLLGCYDFVFHLRKPGASKEAFLNFLQDIPEKHYPKIVIHDHYDLALKYDFYGLHFSTINRKYRKQINHKCTSTSCHSFQEILDIQHDYSYAFLSPVFNSVSKEGYKSGFSLEDIQEFLLKNSNTKVVALGGIDNISLQNIRDLNFYGCAVLGSIWGDEPENNNNIEQNFKNIYTCLQKDHIV